MTTRELLVEAAVTARHPRDPSGTVRSHTVLADLDADGRREVYEAIVRARALEAVLDGDGLSSTARAVLARVRAE